MKILMLNYEYPPLGGGAGRISQNISEQLVDLGHQVTVITTWFDGTKEEDNIAGKPTIIRIKSKRKKQFQSNPLEMLDWILKSWKYLQTFLLNEKYDLCFANFTIPGGWLALKIKRKFDIPYVIISHGHDVPWFYKKQMFVYHLFTYCLIKKIVLKAEYLFVQSKFMRKNAEKFLGKKHVNKIVQIPNGVVPRDIDSSLRKQTYFTILHVGRLVKQKNPMAFLRALRRLNRMQIPYHAYIIGDGKLRTKLEKWMVKNKLNHVKITGWLTNDEVWKFYESAHVMVMPSEVEGMSISNLEALSAGLYLIATPASGNHEMLECCFNGELVAFNNDRDIANALQRFYFEQYLTKRFVSDEYRKAFVKQFAWKNVAKIYESYLLTIIPQTED